MQSHLIFRGHGQRTIYIYPTRYTSTPTKNIYIHQLDIFLGDGTMTYLKTKLPRIPPLNAYSFEVLRLRYGTRSFDLSHKILCAKVVVKSAVDSSKLDGLVTKGKEKKQMFFTQNISLKTWYILNP